MGKGGENLDTGPSTSGAAQLAADERFAPFLEDSFNPTEFASRALAGAQATAQAQVEALQEGIRVLNGQLRAEIAARHDALLRGASRLGEADSSLANINMAVGSLQSALRRVRTEISDPYQQVRLKTQQLRALHETVELLRHTIHRLKLAAKLRAQLAQQGGGIIDLAKAAKLAADIEALGQEADLRGLAVVDADEEFLSAAGQQIRAQAEDALKRGMESLSQAEVGSALQVYFNLGQLKEAVAGLIEQYSAHVERSVAAALDPRKLSAAAGSASGGPGGARSAASPTPGSSAKWQETLWQKLAAVMEQLGGSAVAVWHLQRVLYKKRDPLSHVLFIDVVVGPDDPLPTEIIWVKLTRVVTECMAGAANPARGGFVREALIGSYPKLAQLLEGMFEKLRHDTEVKGVPPAVVPAQQEALLAAAAPFQNAYLAASLQRTSDVVTGAFPGGNRSLPTPAELQKCIGRLHEEVKVVGDSGRLGVAVAAGIGKALHLLAERALYMAATGPDVRSAAGAVTSAQLRNISLASQLQEVHRSMLSLLPRMPPASQHALSAPLESVQNAAVEVVMPIFRSMVDMAEELIMAMHAQDWGGQEGTAVTNASRYMDDLARHITHCRIEFLSKFAPTPSPVQPSFAGALVERMARRLLVFFLRHAALLRPLSQTGKLQLAKDMAELEVAVGQNLWPLEQLGPPFRALRAFRPLLFLDTGAVAASPLLRELPPAVVAHHLYSRAPPGLQSPLTRASLTPAQYSAWLDQHSPEEVLKSIRAALEGSPAAAKEQPESLYALMLQLCTPAK